LSAVDPAAAANGAGSPAAEAEPAGVAIDSGGRTVDPAGGKAAPLDGAAGEAAAQPAEAPPPAVAAGPSAPADPAGVAHAAAGTGASGDGPGDGEPAAEASDQTAKLTATGRKKAPARRGSFLRELPVLLVVAFGLALLIKTFLVQAFFIPSGSMEKTLHGCTGCSGDRVLVNKLVYRFHDPRPGDIVVFRGPESWAPEAQFAKPGNVVTKVFRAIGSAVGVAPAGEKDFVKRVIAVGGQTVQCCDPQGRVVVDGRPLDEPYVYLSDPDNRPQTFGPLKVPDGRLWMMGDHRDESADSRAHMSDADQGTIGVSDVIGKAFVIVWPPSRWDTLGTPSTFSSAATASAPYVVGLGLVAPVGMVRHRRRRGR
jgi:signal peptidase I